MNGRQLPKNVGSPNFGKNTETLTIMEALYKT